MLNDTELLKGAAASTAHVTGSEEVARQTEPLLQPCCAAQRWVPECAPVGSWSSEDGRALRPKGISAMISCKTKKGIVSSLLWDVFFPIIQQH